MGNNVREETMDLDLNLEPSDPAHGTVTGLGSLLNELETAHGRIEERIRQLEAITSRTRQRQRWRQGQSNVQMVNISVEPSVAILPTREVGIDPPQRTIENGKFGKKDGSHLIAKALAMDTDTKQAGNSGGGFFDCNICLDMARDPILTHCGHLFCWPCFFQLPYAYSSVKECPVCEGEVKDESIIPIYGTGSNNNEHRLKSKESFLKVPPRPKAPRIQSVRQQLINRGPFPSPIEIRRIQQFNNIMGTVTGRPWGSQDFELAHITGERTNSLPAQYRILQELPSREADGNQHRRLPMSRLLPDSIFSLSSALTSAMDSAERLVEDLEEYINNNNLRRSHQESSHADRDSFNRAAAGIQPESHSLDTAAEIDSGVPLSASSLRTDVPANLAQLENETRDTATEVNLIMPSSSSSRRRNVAMGLPDVDNEVSREHRRRRLR